MIAGKAEKPGAALMKPPSRTQRADFVKIADRRLRLGQNIDGREARGGLAGLDRNGAADLAGVGRIELAIGAEGQLARNDEQRAGDDEGNIIGDGRGRGGQRNAKGRQSRLRLAHR